MKPELFKIGPISIKGYGTMIAIGILSGLVMLYYRTRKRETYNADDIFDMAIIAVLAGIIGGKLLYILTIIKTVIKTPSSIINDAGNGFVIYGAIILGALAVFVYCKRKKWNALSILDLCIPSVALGQGFGRIGCFLAGCCYGKETTLPIGITFTNSPFAPSGEKLYPTELMSSGFDFLLTLVLLLYAKRHEQDKKNGGVFGIYLIAYSVGRFFIEFIRGDIERGFIGMFSTSQLISVFTFIIGIIVFNYDKIKSRIVE